MLYTKQGKMHSIYEVLYQTFSLEQLKYMVALEEEELGYYLINNKG